MPHVMDYQEIQEAAKANRTIWAENKLLDHCLAMTFDGVDFVNTSVGSFLMLMELNEEECPDYNRNYRCWNEFPGKELMESTPWKDNPFKE